MAKKKKVTTTVTKTEEIVDFPINEKTQIVCILDRSGSMADNGIINESINGFNRFLKEQKSLPDKASITVALFDDQYQLLYDDVDIAEVEDITKEIWYPRGMTALYDAIGKTINSVKANHIKLGNEKPSKVLVCIVTDGFENASKEYSLGKIKNLIKECEKDKWNFIYLAANQDAFAVGASFGVSAGNTLNFTASAAGAAVMTATMSNASFKYRSAKSTDDNFESYTKNLIENDEDSMLKNNNTLTTTNGTSTVINK